MTQALKIAKDGKNLAEPMLGKDYAFSTEFNYLKEAVSGLDDTDNNGDLTITHNLGYVPAFTVFVADYSSQGVWYSYDWVGNVYATSTTLVITGAMGAIKSKVYYALFSSEL